jgi:hypothetical protein
MDSEPQREAEGPPELVVLSLYGSDSSNEVVLEDFSSEQVSNMQNTPAGRRWWTCRLPGGKGPVIARIGFNVNVGQLGVEVQLRAAHVQRLIRGLQQALSGAGALDHEAGEQ